MRKDQTIPVSAPVDTDSAGRGGLVARQSVIRVICPDQNSSGTGFLHKSGRIITAAHVVLGCEKPRLMRRDGSTGRAKVESLDHELDLAILRPIGDMGNQFLPISSSPDLAIGAQVSTWGFPGGYYGITPLLSVGYLAGMNGRKTASGQVVKQWVVNAAFNSGNSGGPLIHIETGQVIGVVSSKLAPISPSAQSALSALTNQRSGFMHTADRPDGTQIQVSEGQIVASVLNELRQQVQLVIGMAVLLDDLTSFLKSHQIDP